MHMVIYNSLVLVLRVVLTSQSMYASADNNLQNAVFHPASVRARTQQQKDPLKGDIT